MLMAASHALQRFGSIVVDDPDALTGKRRLREEAQGVAQFNISCS
jgi:hypothetical protein